ncbi:GNAT family N-acetyltransferase [Flavobacterium cellulosilyticum]|uniref:GNAT family N-acetyltransferase n=1 Tax=Flavobacterium cellulosilyticum TaxID=2541731 RepID=A0A4R5CGA6_9FLAO|nr:GNAT family N-acetyltransferase [Flavobacterium cellulosilyticum]TDD97480.1 GNAT family N-acetyltransferase [Flavobacterium cellulosilyticum]
MIVIYKATVVDIETIQAIAKETWPVAYRDILSKTQLDYMLNQMYSDSVLKESIINKEHHFILAKENDICLGFASFEHHYLNKETTRIHKLYILPSIQGRGVGKLLVDAVVNFAQEKKSTSLSLNVNRYNKAVIFYKKNGFEIIAEEDIEIGNGFLMEDYKMEKKI